MKERISNKQSNCRFKMSKRSAFSDNTKVKCKTHCCRMLWSRHKNMGLDKFTDDRSIRGITDNLMQPLAPKASESICWQKQGSHMKGRSSGRFLCTYPCAFTRCPAEARQAPSLIKNGHSYILTQQEHDFSSCSFYNPDCLSCFIWNCGIFTENQLLSFPLIEFSFSGESPKQVNYKMGTLSS